MATITHPRRSVPVGDRAGGFTKPFLGLAVLLAALIGFGFGWLVLRDASTDLPSEVSELMDNYQGAWNTQDGDKALALMANNGVFHSPFVSAAGLTGGEFAAHVSSSVGGAPIAEFETISGDNPYLLARSGVVAGREGFSVFHLVQEDGDLRILNHTWLQE